MTNFFQDTVQFIRKIYDKKEGFIPLHEPKFIGNEKKYVLDCIDSTYVSSVGKYVDEFEQQFAKYTGANYAVAIVNGTSALHLSLIACGVQSNDLVITQPISFVATANSITYTGAQPLFIDVDMDTLSLSPSKMLGFLKDNTIINKEGYCEFVKTKQIIRACVPMHTFGLSGRIDELLNICNEYNIVLIEDAAESIGTTFNGRHSGTYGKCGTFSFNGNKTITAGGGGAIITNDEKLAKYLKHLSTQAKIPHSWEFNHDLIGYNYRMPNLNAALLLAQLENVDFFISKKREKAQLYQEHFDSKDGYMVKELTNTVSNYWLNALILDDRHIRDEFLAYANKNGVMVRPIWNLLTQLEPFKNCFQGDLSNAIFLENRVVNLPSSIN